MSRAELFLKRQKRSSSSVSPFPSSSQSTSEVLSPHVATLKQQPAAPEQPVFDGFNTGLPQSTRRKWPGIVCGVIGGLLLLCVVGQWMDSAGGSNVPASRRSVASVSENVKSEINRYFTVTGAEVDYWFNQIRISPHVAQNMQYRNIASTVESCYKEDDSSVNAFACLAEAGGKPVRIVCMCSGAVRFSRLASLAVAAQQLRTDGSCARFLRALRPRDCGRMDEERMIELVRQVGLASALTSPEVITRARSISDGMLLGVLAHELGHHVYGHTLGKVQNLEIARNQERDADSFASSIIQANSFGEHILEGTLIWWYALARQESSNGETTTHPASRERYRNFVHDNASMARMLGFTE